MNRGLLEDSAPAFVREPLAALRRAARIARQVGIIIGTGIVIVEHGRVVHKSPDELRRELDAAERSGAAGDSDL